MSERGGSRRDRIVRRWQAIVSGEAGGVVAPVVRLSLLPLAMIYGFVMSFRRWLYRRGWWRSHPTPIPVISVGNLTVGGTGKTPCVEMMARDLCCQGFRVVILSRGYGSCEGRNDEALVLEENLPDVPHLQGINRRELLQIAVDELESEVALLDDGFQHLRLSRSLDIVLLDASDPWGGGWPLPRGLLREPRGALKDADVVILTRSDQISSQVVAEIRRWIERRVPGCLICEAVHEAVGWQNHKGEIVSLHRWAARPTAAFCGIGNPEAFRASLLRLGVDVKHWRTFPDHHAYTRRDVEELSEWARSLPPEGIVLTTQKDLVKLRIPEIGGRPLWALRVAFRVTEGEVTLRERIRKAVDA